MAEMTTSRVVCDITRRGHKDGIKKYSLVLALQDNDGTEILNKTFDAGAPGLASLCRVIEKKLAGPQSRTK